MKRNYRIYKKNGYIYVHYEGFPKGVKIEKNETLYDYDWGWMTVSKDGGYYDFHDEDYELFFNGLWDGTIFSREGKYGIQDDTGKEVLPPVFDQIEKLSESVFGRLGHSYWEIRESGTSTLRGNYSETGFFVKNGKKGWQVDGQVVIPAIYDSIYHYNDSNFYQVQQDGELFCINENGERVLTNFKEIENDEDQYGLPFHSGRNDVIVLQEYIGHEAAEDNNVVILNGVWQRLDKISGNEICELLINPNDELPVTMKDLDLFNNDFSYEFASYQVKSHEPSGIIDCLNKLQSMGLHSNTWHYIVKVWKPVGEKPTAEELRHLRYQIEEHGQLGKLVFALGHDSDLASGETKMFVVTHYNERCWPATWEMDWWSERSELSLSQIKRRLTKLRKTIDSEVLEQYKDEVWQDQLSGCIYGMEYNKNRSWDETIKVLEYFKRKGAAITNGIRKECEEIDCTLALKFRFSRRQCEFHYKKLKWLLENGADINAHYENLTSMDFILGNKEHYVEKDFSERDKEYIEAMRKKYTELLLKHGAMTMQQLKEEESKNDDYRVELTRMK